MIIYTAGKGANFEASELVDGSSCQSLIFYSQ